jgi:hypothetical protein
MLDYLRRNHVGLLALFVALGGTSYAAIKLPPNSVTSKQVKNASLRAVDFKKGQLPRGATGLTGLPGAAGSKGDAGGKGDPGEKGAKGDTGTQGPVGPTFASIGSMGGAAPPDSPESMPRVSTFTTPSAGKLMVFGRETRTVTCDNGGTTVFWGLYIDGQPIAGVTQNSTSGQPIKLDMWGLTPVVPAGEHQLALGADCFASAIIGNSGSADDQLGALLVGSG